MQSAPGRPVHISLVVLVLPCLFALGCSDPLPVYRGVGSVTAEVGPEGGELKLASGIELKIPRNALTAIVAIELKELSDLEVTALPAVPSGPGLEPKAPISLTPHGTTFLGPVKATVPLAGVAESARVKVFRLDGPSATTWMEIPSRKVNGKVEFETMQFSFYVVIVDTTVTDGGSPDGDGGVTIRDGSTADDSTRTDASSPDGDTPDAGLDTGPTDAFMDPDFGPDATPMDAGPDPDMGIPDGATSDSGAA
jgi:hypothetical protein